MEILDTLNELDTWLEGNYEDVHNQLGPPATNADLERLVAGLKKNGFPKDGELPSELRALLSWRSNGDLDRAFLGRDLMDVDWIVEHHGIMMGHASERPEEPGFFHPGWISFVDNDYSVLCIDAVGTFGESPGGIVFVDFKGGESRAVKAPSIAKWFQLYLTLLKHPIAGKALASEWHDEEMDDDELDAAFDALTDLEAEFIPKLFPGYPKNYTVHDSA